MDNLTRKLCQLRHGLDQLGQILKAEYQLLMVIPLQPIALQSVTNDKSRLLSTVAHYDTLRQKAETACCLQAPYTRYTELTALWAQIQSQTRLLHEQNRRNGIQLEAQMTHVRSLSAVIKTLMPDQIFYCADGAFHHDVRLQNFDINA